MNRRPCLQKLSRDFEWFEYAWALKTSRSHVLFLKGAHGLCVGIGSGGGDASFTREGSGGRRAIRGARWIDACVGSLRERTPGSPQINLASAHAPRNSIAAAPAWRNWRTCATIRCAVRERAPGGWGSKRREPLSTLSVFNEVLGIVGSGCEKSLTKRVDKGSRQKGEGGVGLKGSTQQHLVAWTGSTFLIARRVKIASAPTSRCCDLRQATA